MAIRLTPTEWNVLEVLVRNEGKLVPSASSSRRSGVRDMRRRRTTFVSTSPSFGESSSTIRRIRGTFSPSPVSVTASSPDSRRPPATAESPPWGSRSAKERAASCAKCAFRSSREAECRCACRCQARRVSGPDRIRTCDLRLRRPTLYWAWWVFEKGKAPPPQQPGGNAIRLAELGELSNEECQALAKRAAEAKAVIESGSPRNYIATGPGRREDASRAPGLHR